MEGVSVFSLPDPITMLCLGIGLLACAIVMGVLHVRTNSTWEGNHDDDD